MNPVGWSSYEVALRDHDGGFKVGRKPFAEELFSGRGDPIQTALQKMELLQAHGWPHARLAMKDKKGKALIDRADDKNPDIWILKCKPSCWRLYFHVYAEKSRIVYLLACCKKQQARDPADSSSARGLFEGIGGPTGSGIALFKFPGE